MPSRRLKWIIKLLLASAFLLFLKQLAKWPYSFHSVLLETREIKNGQEIESGKGMDNSQRNRVLDHPDYKYKSKTYNGKVISGINSDEITRNLYGFECPPNPHKKTLKYLFNYWMLLDYHYNLSSFLCGGSLIGSLRDRDLIPYDRDVDVCVTLENYQKLRVLRSGKPFRHSSHRIYLAVQEDFANDNVWNRTRVDCKGRIVQLAKDPCSFETPGARLISRGVYVDVFVFREHGVYLRDHEYEQTHLKADIFPLKYCTFMDVKTKCPQDEMSLLLKYYKPDVLTKPHYKCENSTWVVNSQDATKDFKIWFNKRLERHNARKKSV